MSFLIEIIQEIKALSPQKRDLRRFGLVLAVVLLLLAGYLLWRGRGAGLYCLGAGLLWGFLGLAWPRGLGPFYRLWMSLAIILGFFMPRLLLILFFYGALTPMGLILRLFGKDLLNLKPEARESYWNIRPVEEYDPRRTEKMY